MRNMVATSDDRDLSNKEKEHTHTCSTVKSSILQTYVNSSSSQLGAGCEKGLLGVQALYPIKTEINDTNPLLQTFHSFVYIRTCVLFIPID